jgi:prepilin-type N-terminal cleavage/methylation domain-containing protein
MHAQKHKIRGFTLIEVTLALAISTLMILLLFGTYRNARRRAAFTDAIERVVTTLEQAKTEAVSTVNVKPASPGTTSGRVVFAKAVDFATSSNQQYTRTLLADRSDTLQNIALSPEVQSSTVPWQVGFLSVGSGSTHDFVVFTRSVADGRLNTYVFDLATFSNLPAANYSTVSNPADTAVATLAFQDPNGLRANVKVNAATSEITREFLN